MLPIVYKPTILPYASLIGLIAAATIAGLIHYSNVDQGMPAVLLCLFLGGGACALFIAAIVFSYSKLTIHHDRITVSGFVQSNHIEVWFKDIVHVSIKHRVKYDTGRNASYTGEGHYYSLVVRTKDENETEIGVPEAERYSILQLVQQLVAENNL